MVDTIQGGVGFLIMNTVGYEAVILSSRRNRFSLTYRTIIIANRHVVVNLYCLKNVGIKSANHILAKIAYIFNPNKHILVKQASQWGHCITC